MDDLISKISSYNLFNYLFPGIIFVVLLNEITPYSFIQSNIIEGFFVYYFCGLAISRVGSLLIEPFLKRIGFVKFGDYSKFLHAIKKDPKIELLSEQNNMLRTLISCLLLLLLALLFNLLDSILSFSSNLRVIILIVVSLLLFLFSYKKQINFIKKRVSLNGEKNVNN